MPASPPALVLRRLMSLLGADEHHCALSGDGVSCYSVPLHHGSRLGISLGHLLLFSLVTVDEQTNDMREREFH